MELLRRDSLGAEEVESNTSPLNTIRNKCVDFGEANGEEESRGKWKGEGQRTGGLDVGKKN